MSYAERPEMTLRDYSRVIYRLRWIVFATIVFTVTPALTLSLMKDPLYEASAAMIIRSQPGDTLFGSGSQGYVDPDRVVANEVAVLQSEVVYARLIENLDLQAPPPGVIGRGFNETDVVSVSVQSDDPETAAIIANGYVDAYIDVKQAQSVDGLVAVGDELQSQISNLQGQIDALDEQIDSSSVDDDTVARSQRDLLISRQALFKQKLDELQVDAALTSGSASLIREAVPPIEPIEPNPKRTAMLAAVVGLLLGLGIAFLIHYLDDSIRSADDFVKVGSDLPLLAVIPIDSLPDNRPFSLSKPGGFAAESYRTLRTNVQFLGIEGDVRVLQITSAMPGEGKTTTAANLAVVLAQTGASVVLVDADLRKPQIHRVFAIDGSVGLTNNLVGESIEMTVSEVDVHLTIIASGPVPPNPSEMLSGKRMEVFIADLRKRYDYVIVDSAPTLPVSDAVALSRHVDGVLLVVQANRTSAPQVRQTLATLEKVGAPVLGLALNKANPKHAGDDLGYSYGQHYGAAKPVR